VRQALAILKPPPELSISDWADANRRLSSEASAEPGQWRTSRAEYQRGIMDAISNGAVESVVVMSSSQVGKSEALGNAVGYYIDQDPAPIMVVMPTERVAEAWSKDRFSPMARDTPCLAGRISDPKSRDGRTRSCTSAFRADT
jgi:phage terminase large subunit GpA-like protein